MPTKTCNGCGTDEIATVTMSEGAWERHEERNKKLINKLIAVILVLVVLLVGSNVAWLIYESQFETAEETSTVITEDYKLDSGESGNAIVNGEGSVVIGSN